MQLIDINGNGLIEYHEFVAALRQFGPAELSDSQIYDVMRAMDLNNDNCIEMYEFVKRFEVIRDASSSAASVPMLLLYCQRLLLLLCLQDREIENGLCEEREGRIENDRWMMTPAAGQIDLQRTNICTY